MRGRAERGIPELQRQMLNAQRSRSENLETFDASGTSVLQPTQQRSERRRVACRPTAERTKAFQHRCRRALHVQSPAHTRRARALPKEVSQLAAGLARPGGRRRNMRRWHAAVRRPHPLPMRVQTVLTCRVRGEGCRRRQRLPHPAGARRAELRARSVHTRPTRPSRPTRPTASTRSRRRIRDSGGRSSLISVRSGSRSSSRQDLRRSRERRASCGIPIGCGVTSQAIRRSTAHAAIVCALSGGG